MKKYYLLAFDDGSFYTSDSWEKCETIKKEKKKKNVNVIKTYTE